MPLSPPQLLGIDHLEWWVGNARTFAGFLASAFGFDFVAYAGPETGWRDRVSYLLRQGEIRFVVTGALDPDSPIAAHVRAHGDGVRDVAFAVDDAAAAYDAAIDRGAIGFHPPEIDEDDKGKIVWGTIAAYGDTNHTFVERRNHHGLWAPRWAPARHHRPVGADVGLRKIDHVVANVELGALRRWVSFYERVFAFDRLVHFDDDAISTEYS
ncbi:MAG: VOC family protein, partial [Actinomycetota bacterium]